MSADSRQLIHEVRDEVLWIGFNRPQARNALTFEMYEGLASLCSGIKIGGGVKAVVIYGAGGKAFAAGTDMAQFRSFKTKQDALDYERQIADVLGAVEQCPVATIAAITGACTGGGAAIAAACDIRLATQNLKFGVPIARTLGNCLSAGNLALLTELIGAGRVRELMLTARLIGADEARSIGLVSEILADEDSLISRAEDLAADLTGMAPLTIFATKEAMRRNRISREVEDSDLITLCYMSGDFKTGMEAFLAKKKPDWIGS